MTPIMDGPIERVLLLLMMLLFVLLFCLMCLMVVEDPEDRKPDSKWPEMGSVSIYEEKAHRRREGLVELRVYWRNTSTHY